MQLVKWNAKPNSKSKPAVSAVMVLLFAGLDIRIGLNVFRKAFSRKMVQQLWLN